jgi:hypothetical protein
MNGFKTAALDVRSLMGYNIGNYISTFIVSRSIEIFL